MAQLEAQAICNRQVVGSSPTTGSVPSPSGAPDAGARLAAPRAVLGELPLHSTAQFKQTSGMKLHGMAFGALTIGALVLAGCSSSTSSTPTTTSTTAASTTSTTTAASTTTTGGSSTTTGQATNQPVTDALRTQLLAVGAALANAPVSQYTGLAPGETYYAIDGSTGTAWAAARLVPAPVANGAQPSQAQISSQDEGSYTLFRMEPGQSWQAFADGNAGPGTACPVAVPAAVVSVWGWPAGSCRPSNV